MGIRDRAVTASNGLVNISNTVANKTCYVMYWGSKANRTGTAVTVACQADPTGITVTLNESGPATGIFRANILAISSASEASANHSSTTALSTSTLVLAILQSANTHEATFAGVIPGLYDVPVTA